MQMVHEAKEIPVSGFMDYRIPDEGHAVTVSENGLSGGGQGALFYMGCKFAFPAIYNREKSGGQSIFQPRDLDSLRTFRLPLRFSSLLQECSTRSVRHHRAGMRGIPE